MAAAPALSVLAAMTARQRVVMVATSYPRFAGDTVGTFMEPIATGLASRGHEVHLVLPWHPRWQRGDSDGGVRFHLFKYAPGRSMNIFGYAGALEADERLRGAAVAAAPLAMAAAWRAASMLANRIDATIVHGHWVVPGGVIAAAAAGPRPLVISLHGSDVFVAERHRRRWTGSAMGIRPRWLRHGMQRRPASSGPSRSAPPPIGRPQCRTASTPRVSNPIPDARRRLRQHWGTGRRHAGGARCRPLRAQEGIRVPHRRHRRHWRPGILAFGWCWPATATCGGSSTRASPVTRSARVPILPGVLHQDEVAASLAAADVVVVPSVRDPSGNVDGLPNVVMEALASATALVATPAGGIRSVVQDGRTGLLVPEADRGGACRCHWTFARQQNGGCRPRRAARHWVEQAGNWSHALDGFEQAYQMACRPANSRV